MSQRDNGRNGKNSLTAPALTYWPHPSSDVRAWLALIDHGAWDQWGLYDSAIDREMPRYLRRASGLAQDEEAPPIRPTGIPDELWALFVAPNKVVLDELLGVESYDERGRTVEWRPGLAGLDPQESAALRMQIERRFEIQEIAQHMSPRRARFGDRLPLETVEKYLQRARCKLRELFGAGAPGGTTTLTTSPTHSQPSMPTPDASEPTTMTPRISPRTSSFATLSAATSFVSPLPC